MNESHSVTMCCSDTECEFYLVPVDVDTVRESETGACHLRRDEDDWCECGAQREDIEDVRRQLDARRRRLDAEMDGVEWQAEQVRRRYAKATA